MSSILAYKQTDHLQKGVLLLRVWAPQPFIQVVLEAAKSMPGMAQPRTDHGLVISGGCNLPCRMSLYPSLWSIMTTLVACDRRTACFHTMAKWRVVVILLPSTTTATLPRAMSLWKPYSACPSNPYSQNERLYDVYISYRFADCHICIKGSAPTAATVVHEGCSDVSNK